MQYQKVKSVAKSFKADGQDLERAILFTLERCAAIVGATLGPGGKNIVIERQEQGMPPLVTKDGVTVYKNLGFTDPTHHVIMETARDAAVRTASEAGDGTTTATILANAFVKHVKAFCRANPKYSPQRVVRTLEKAFKTVLEPMIRDSSRLVDLNSEEGKRYLHAVAKVSANGDVDLADAVIQCFDLVGDEGNVTILDINGPSKYEVERIDGYGVSIGFEDCCGPFYQKFITDPGTQTCQLDNPLFVLYYGRINDVGVMASIFEKILDAAEGKRPNVVVMATGFSEVVLGHLATNFSHQNKNFSVYPFLVPMSPIKTGQYDFLTDMSALSGAKVFDPIENPLDSGTVADLGGSISLFEASRFRSNIIVDMDENAESRIFEKVDIIQKQLSTIATSELDKQLLRERVGKLTGGIAKLKIYGVSNGETKEKRDRAEDAICAVRGAIKHGTLPAGGWMLLKIIGQMEKSEDVIYREVIAKALQEPITRLYDNAGFSKEEFANIQATMSILVQDNLYQTYDLLEGNFVEAYESGLLDSTPAVLEAIRNSISIASLLGTCGGTIVFGRDEELERKEAQEVASFMRDLNSNEEPITERP